jgi:hypothetical protein
MAASMMIVTAAHNMRRIYQSTSMGGKRRQCHYLMFIIAACHAISMANFLNFWE